MAVPVVEINYVAVLVSAIIGYAVGMVWYTVLFGKEWAKLMGFDQKKMAEAKKKGMAKQYAIGFVGTLVMSLVLAHVLKYSQASSVTEAAMGGFWMWLGFIATVLLGTVLWEGKPVKLYLINSLHYLAALVVMAEILVLWA
ncbi:MAG: DUF1761 domain-containing protein [Candidatus Aenigmarchaeota archaeon]|nr:DUF1761 domain-containing protein [Candidatus Aenigmarchaeota archaeon]